jgi:hypothetical protein
MVKSQKKTPRRISANPKPTKNTPSSNEAKYYELAELILLLADKTGIDLASYEPELPANI